MYENSEFDSLYISEKWNIFRIFISMYESLKLMKVEAVNGINAGDIEKRDRDHGNKILKFSPKQNYLSQRYSEWPFWCIMIQMIHVGH